MKPVHPLTLSRFPTIHQIIWPLFVLILGFNTGCGGKPASPVPIKASEETIIVLPPEITQPVSEKAAEPLSPETEETPVPPTAIQQKDSTFPSPNYSKSIPAEVMKEIVYFGTGGNMGESVPCEYALSEEPHIDISIVGGKAFDQIGSLFDSTDYQTCGWEVGEVVTVNLAYPDGSIQTYDRAADEHTSVIIKIDPAFDDLPGRYHISFEGDQVKLQETFELVDDGKTGYSLLEDYLLLYHFPPHEKVRLFVYERFVPPNLSNKFIGWDEFQVDEDGKLKIKLHPDFQNEYLAFHVVGETIDRSFGDPFCGGAQPTRLKTTSQVVSAVGAIPFAPSFDKLGFVGPPPTRSFSENQPMTILDGPICTNNVYIFWEVAFEDGTSGVIAESGAAGYYLYPAGEALPATISACPNAPPQRVQVGGKAKVCTGSENLIVREQPFRGAPPATKLPPGTEMLIKDGPICASDWSYWKIEAETGDRGWVSEGGDQKDPYFICPIP